jgi:hypothetical protein
MKSSHGEADYLLFVDCAPIGVVEAEKEGDTLTGVELQTTKYSEGVPDKLPKAALVADIGIATYVPVPPCNPRGICGMFFSCSSTVRSGHAEWRGRGRA